MRLLTQAHISPDATSWSLHGRNETLAASKEWMKGVLRTQEQLYHRSWAVFVSGCLEARDCIGIVTLTPRERSGGDGTWELGYLYRAEAWGKGYATESCGAAIEALKADLRVEDLSTKPKLVAWIDPDNLASLKVGEKLGFKVMYLKKFGTPPVKLGGEWREDGVLVLERDL